MSKNKGIQGAGLGLRREMLDELLESPPAQVDFWEVAPENWMRLGGKFGKQFRALTERHSFLCHGLSLSIGAPTPLDVDFVKAVKRFMDEHQIEIYSEHLSYCSGHGHMYDLLPIPFTTEAASYVAERVKQVQDIIERPLVLENVSYYAAPGQELAEIDFINQVLDEADCELLLDVNNIYVNSINHNYDPKQFLSQLPSDRIRYIHVAGHYNEAEDLIVDTHGAEVIDPVWTLLEEAYRIHGVHPTLLERDFNIPPMSELVLEVDQIHSIQRKVQSELEAISA
ncbi:DUF692 domain-containing protein [Corallincola platygyrae]|uniref:UPF0276 protein ACFSJ3_19110 n=1 Tax=Corallincola platygyrae TaxID=1193278 RepID=A0ABW4XRA2_9GAMM